MKMMMIDLFHRLLTTDNFMLEHFYVSPRLCVAFVFLYGQLTNGRRTSRRGGLCILATTDLLIIIVIWKIQEVFGVNLELHLRGSLIKSIFLSFCLVETVGRCHSQ